MHQNCNYYILFILNWQSILSIEIENDFTVPSESPFLCAKLDNKRINRQREREEREERLCQISVGMLATDHGDIVQPGIGQIGHLGVVDGPLLQQVLTPQEHPDEDGELGAGLGVLEGEDGGVDLGGEALALEGREQVAEGRLARVVEGQQGHCALQLLLDGRAVLAVLAQVALRELQRLFQPLRADQFDQLLLLRCGEKQGRERKRSD